jgi:hypothetical protein
VGGKEEVGIGGIRRIAGIPAEGQAAFPSPASAFPAYMASQHG